MKQTVGVLGGIGPESTAEYYRRLVREMQRRDLVKRNADYPHVVINSIPAPELVNRRITRAALRDYRRGVRELARWGADFIVMVCNTIHCYHGQLQRQSRVPIIDLREEVCRQIGQRGAKSVVILGTNNTVAARLYEMKGIKYLVPNRRDQAQISRIIVETNAGRNRAANGRHLRSIMGRYLSRGADAVILGCTELAMLLKRDALPKIDTIDVMVDATVRRLGGGE